MWPKKKVYFAVWSRGLCPQTPVTRSLWLVVRGLTTFQGGLGGHPPVTGKHEVGSGVSPVHVAGGSGGEGPPGIKREGFGDPSPIIGRPRALGTTIACCPAGLG